MLQKTKYMKLKKKKKNHIMKSIMSMKTTPMVLSFQTKINEVESLKMVINDNGLGPKIRKEKLKANWLKIKEKPEERIREEKESGLGCEEDCCCCCCCCCCCGCFPLTPKMPRALEPARGCNSIPSHRWILLFQLTITIHLLQSRSHLPLYRSRFPLQFFAKLQKLLQIHQIYIQSINFIFLYLILLF